MPTTQRPSAPATRSASVNTAPEEDELLHPVFPLISSMFSTIAPCMREQSRPKSAAPHLPTTLPFSAVVPTFESTPSETLPPVILKRAAEIQPPFSTISKYKEKGNPLC